MNRTSSACRALLGLAAGLSVVGASLASAQPTSPLNPPPNGPRHADASWHALTNATVHSRPDTTVEHATIIIKDGRIDAVLSPAAGDTKAPPAPAGARAWDCTGLHVYAGFIDSYVEVDAPRPDPNQPGVHWNSRVTPQRSALDGTGLPDATAESLRKLGFTAAAISPSGGIFRGRAAVVSLAKPASEMSLDRPPVYSPNAYHAMGFDLGRGFGMRAIPANPSTPLTPSPAIQQDQGPDVVRWSRYPDSEMGAIALMRQTFIDEEWQEDARKAGQPLAYNSIDTLSPEWARNMPDRTVATAKVGDKGSLEPMPLLFDTQDELEALRAAKVAREFKRSAMLLGSGTEFRRLDAIKADGLPIILPLSFPRAPDVSSIGRADSVELREMMTWEQAPTNPRRLDAAGVKLALTTAKLRNRADFSDNLTKAMRHGLKPERALAMLTTQPADILGVSDRLGTIEKGKIANLVVTDGDLFEVWPKRDSRPSGDEAKPDDKGNDKAAEPSADANPGDDELTSGRAQPSGRGGRGRGGFAGAAGGGGAPFGGGGGGGGARSSKVRDVWIDGVRHEITPPPAMKLEGTWTVTLDPGPEGAKFSIDDHNAVTVQLNDKRTRARDFKISDNRVSFLIDDSELGLQGTSMVSGVVEGDTIRGTGIDHQGKPFTWTATKTKPDEAKPEEKKPAADETKPDEKKAAELKNDDGKPADQAAAPDAKPEPDAARPRGPRGSRRDPDKDERDAIAAIPEALGCPFGPYMLESEPPQDSIILTNATIWTEGPQGIIQNGWIALDHGKIKAIGSGSPPSGGTVVDCTGKHISPGVIDCHSHTGISRGVNEGGQAVTAEVRIQDVTDPDSISWYRQLASGVTAVNQLHGSANAIGGQNCVTKIRWGAQHPDQMHLDGAMPGIKFALGENPKWSNAGDRSNNRYPQTRMGVETLIRDRFTAAREYLAAHQPQSSGGAMSASATVPPHRDLELEALAEVLDGKRLVHCHSYRQDELLMLCRVADDFHFKIGTFQHVLEGYKVADEIAKHALGGSCFTDWWAYKVEVQDAIPQNGPIMTEQGVVVSFNSDSDELARRLNWETGKAIKYGVNVKPEDALKYVTLNPAKQLMIDKQVGSLEIGKDADLAVWSGPPMSAFSRCEATYVDGRRLFSLEDDAKAREKISAERTRLTQKLLAQARSGRAGGGESSGGASAGGPRPGDDVDSLERFYLDLLNRAGDPAMSRPGECGDVGR
jgi:N-acetylglucosamine-6-phosphate deacetylase